MIMQRLATIFQRVSKKSKKSSNIATTENYIMSQNIKTVPCDGAYASMTKYGKKICIVGHNHIKRVRKISLINQWQMEMSIQNLSMKQRFDISTTLLN